MSAAHRAQAIRKMKEHHEAAKAADARGDSAATKRLMAAAFHARDVAKSIEAGRVVGTASAKDFGSSSSVSGGTAGTSSTSGSTTSSSTSGGGGDSSPFVRTRMGYDPSGELDYTNTNPAYWASAVSYFKGKPEGNPVTGELGIWIPNFEKEGAERTALAAVAGGVTAHVDSNYSNNTVDDAKAKALHAARGDAAGAAGSYRGGAEKAIRLAGVHRGGTDVDTGHPMGSTDSSEHGVYIKGGKVVKGAGADYVKGGGDFGGLLGMGDTITGDWLTGILGAMDGDGMRIGGTYPAVRGATGSGVGAGGTDISSGGMYTSGVDPIGTMPSVADYTDYMDPNSMFGGLSDNAAVKSGLLYQPTASDYGAKMEAAGMPAFSPGLLGSFSSAGAPTYSSTPGSFMKPATGGTSTTSGTGIPIGATTTASGREYAFPTDRPLYGGGMSKDIPTFASLGALSSMHPDLGSYGAAHPGAKGTAKIGGALYTFDGGSEGADGWSPTGFSYPLVTSTA